MARYLFLDIDGVLNDPKTYEELSTIPDKLTGSDSDASMSKFSLEDVIRFNANENYGIGLFHIGNGRWGEVYSKDVVRKYGKLCRELDLNVVIVSSGVSICKTPEDIKLMARVFSELWGMNIVDGFRGGGSADDRILQSMKWMREHANKEDDFLVVDDMVLKQCKPRETPILAAHLYNPLPHKDKQRQTYTDLSVIRHFFIVEPVK